MHTVHVSSPDVDLSRWESFTPDELYVIEYALEIVANEVELPSGGTAEHARSLSNEVERHAPGPPRAATTRASSARHGIIPRWTRCERSPTGSKRIVADDLWSPPNYSEMLFIK